MLDPRPHTPAQRLARRGAAPAAAVAAAVGVGLAACANQSPPPGGPQDLRPPVVIRTVPDTFGQLLDRNGEVRFQFNERISETVSEGDLSSAVSVSPQTGEVRVDHNRTSLTVSLEGGFRPGVLYRVTLLPVVSDMFGNRMRDAFELVFSTGGDVTPEGRATLAGEVWDRLTGRGLNGATVLAVGPDSLVYVARADQQGVFAFRFLPTGDFLLTGYLDQDRNRVLGPREARGSVPVSVAAGDTAVVEIPALPPDTTPAVASGASVLDSVTVVVEFDDYLDPRAPADQIGIRLTRDGGEAPVVSRLFHEVEYARYVEQVADSFARLDSIAAAARPRTPTQAPPADTGAVPTVPDTATAAPAVPDAAAPDTATRPVPPAPVADTAPTRPIPARLSGTPPLGRGGRTPPGRRLVGVLDGPLVEGRYEIRVTSVTNINGLPGGGGEAAFSYEPPPPPADTLDLDDVGAAADSSALPAANTVPDSLGLFP